MRYLTGPAKPWTSRSMRCSARPRPTTSLVTAQNAGRHVQEAWDGPIPAIAWPSSTITASRQHRAKSARSHYTGAISTAIQTPSSSSATGTAPKQRATSSAATGCSQVTSQASMKKATSGTRDVRTTCSRRQATGSVRPRSRTAWSSTRPSRTRRSSPSRMLNGVTSSRPSSC